ncbi:general stress protein A [Spirochaetia bacterium]|nr:general stress protein A [Spirochaetia bacterium]
MTEKPIVPIVFTSLDNYVPPLSVALQSIMENADTERNEYRFFILYTDITSEHQEALRAQAAAFPHCSLTFIDVSAHVAGITFANLNFTEAAYYRFLIPGLLGEYERVIYLDCDIICLTDIALLLDPDYGDAVLGAPHTVISDEPERAWVRENAIGIGMADYRNYFCAGIMVFNIKPFNSLISQDALLRLAAANTYIYADQDILNVLCEGRVRYIPMKWNTVFDRDIPSILEAQAAEYEESRTNPAILHLNSDKPWKENTGADRHTRFWDYASRTPFAAELRALLQENVSRLAAPIDPETDEAIFFSNNIRETEQTEARLKAAGIAAKRGSGAEGCAFNVYVSRDDVEKAFAVLMETGGDE